MQNGYVGGRQDAISDSLTSAKQRVRSAAISASIAASVLKTRVKIQREKNRYDYWKAEYIDYGDDRGTYIPTTPIDFSRAAVYVRGGGSVFADSRGSAYRLALAVGNGKAPTKSERHRHQNGSQLGYWRHYHDGGRIGGHIFYVG